MKAEHLPPAVREAILAVLRQRTGHAAGLPDPLPVGRLIFLRDPAVRGGDSTRVIAGAGDSGYHLDYFRRDEHSAWHARIHADGREEDLENYEGQVGLKVFPDPAENERERQRVYAHNAQVRELLRKKGFED
ncbi:MAG: hypothetical protein HS111_20380 [Kofleriaceae bacterium]|nr:hypothetical protein [Kofleriaceae bacterium]MCL4225330.1 hypothetical protein [Myxococcales bacterium]